MLMLQVYKLRRVPDPVLPVRVLIERIHGPYRTAAIHILINLIRAPRRRLANITRPSDKRHCGIRYRG